MDSERKSASCLWSHWVARACSCLCRLYRWPTELGFADQREKTLECCDCPVFWEANFKLVLPPVPVADIMLVA